MMKKFTVLLMSAALLYAVSCDKVPQTSAHIPVTGVNLDITEIELNVGKTVTLTASVQPEGATDKTVTWTSSVPEVVSVDENGTIKALAAGNATVTVTTTDGEMTAECNVQVSPVAVTDVELDITELEIEVGETATLTATVLPEDATDKTVTWLSSAPEIASVDENGTVEGLVAGNSVITVTTADGGKTAECNVMVTPTINGHEYVDLGLSVKWATCNVGAENPWDSGEYFAWGETEPKEVFTSDNSLTHGIADMPDISGNPEYDAARANWGGTWRIPDDEELYELKEKCRWLWATDHGIEGYRIFGPNGKSIFLPAARSKGHSGYNSADGYGYYWGSTPEGTNKCYRLIITIYSNTVGTYFRYFGQSVRPVSD